MTGAFDWNIGPEDIPVEVEYEYFPAEPAILDPDSPGVGPGRGADAALIRVWLGHADRNPTKYDLLPVLSPEVEAALRDRALEKALEDVGGDE